MAKKNTKKISFIDKIIIFANLISAIFLVFAYLSTKISPADISLFALFGLVYPILFLGNLLFAIFWAIRKKWLFLISFIVILIGYNFILDSFQINLLNQKADINSLKLMSYNVRLFNKYNWNKNKNTASEILSFLEKEEPDILCLQEYYSTKTDKNLYYHKKIKKLIDYKDYYIAFGVKEGRKYNYGIATYSKFPIINEGTIKYNEEKDISIFTDIVTNKDTIRVYNCHFQSINLGYEDYNLINNEKENESNKIIGAYRITKKLNSAYKKRAEQVLILKKHINVCPYKTIICGDFNDLPTSYVYTKISENLDDAFKRSGQGIGNTYIRSFSFFRIDYILHSKLIKSYNYKKHEINHSDHYPISCEIEL